MGSIKRGKPRGILIIKFQPKRTVLRGAQEDELSAVWNPLGTAPRWTEYATEALANSNIQNYPSGKMFYQPVQIFLFLIIHHLTFLMISEVQRTHL